jgi:hypothetical protein
MDALMQEQLLKDYIETTEVLFAADSQRKVRLSYRLSANKYTEGAYTVQFIVTRPNRSNEYYSRLDWAIESYLEV